MMTKRKSPPRNRIKYLLALPFLTLVILVVCCNNNDQIPLPPPPPPPPPPAAGALDSSVYNAENGYAIVDRQAQFQGGDINTFRDWVQKKVIYPEEAFKKKISGKVTIQFTVDTKGKTGDFKVLRSPDPLLSDAVMQALTQSSDWKPALLNGKDVKQMFVIPVEFTLD
jgi:TonB family protein